MSPSAGLAFGLVRRIREAFWGAVGYAVLVMWRAARVAASGSGV